MGSSTRTPRIGEMLPSSAEKRLPKAGVDRWRISEVAAAFFSERALMA
jgi:hypothetical protein